MPELPQLTRRQAEAAIERSGESIALTSGAGCGKTLVLARRFTELLMSAGGESPFDRLIALTFTEKAALEMIGRVRAVLLEAARQSKDAGERQRFADWITELPGAHISTIHSFCASLLRRHAIEAGVDPAFAVLADELVAAQMQAQAAEEAVLSAVEAGEGGAVELLARVDLWPAVRDVQTLMGRRIAWQEDDYSDPDRTLRQWCEQRDAFGSELLARLAADPAVRNELDALAGCPCSNPGDKLLAYRDEKLATIRRILAEPDAVSLDSLKALARKAGNAGSPKAWGGKEALGRYRRRLSAFVQRFAGLAAWFGDFGEEDTEAARCLAALTALASDALARYDQAKRRSGLLDFDDLIGLTGRLLHENKSVRSALRRQLSQLLIDEGQDTDAYQLEMLWRLLADGEKPPPGKLFVVGDLKQSIYRFRGAQAEVFAALCRRFGRARIPLEETFRPHAAGAEFVNHVFSKLMGQAYEPIISTRKERPPGPSVEILLAEPAGGDARSAAAAQADLLAQRLAEMIGSEKLVFDRGRGQWRPVRRGDVAVLFARMTNSLEYERALRQRDIDYYVVGGTGFFRQQEVYDVLNALRAIDNPFDDVALFGVLRSAVFGLDDNVLLHVAFAARPPYFQKLSSPQVLQRLAGPRREQLQFAHELLGRLHRSKDAIGPAAAIEALLSETGYAAALLSQFQGRRKLGNVCRLLDAARSAQSSGRMSLADFVRRYAELTIEEARYEQAPVVGEADDVVRIMTIHKAKGLEFPVVVVPDLNARRRGPGGRLIFRRDWGITYKPPAATGDEQSGERRDASEPMSFHLAQEAEKEELQAEDVRKLYVAATRHQDHLIFVGTDQRDKGGRLGPAGSHLAQLDEALGVADALDGGAAEIGYGDGFSVRLARAAPGEPSSGRRHRPLGRKLIADAGSAAELADALAGAGRPAELTLVGPLLGPAGDGEGTPAGRIAATALVDFEHCPMLYRWRHELRVPTAAFAGGEGAPAPASGLDTATAGTVFHRCMELLDVAALRPGDAAGAAAQARALVARTLGEMELTVDPTGLAGELEEMLTRLAENPLMEALRTARRRLPELSFLLRAPRLDVAGQIDLLYEDAAGAWHVIDYKSDRLEADGVDARAARYELQMLIYLAAARRHLGPKVAGATLYFLRPGLARRFAADEQTPAGLERRLAGLAGQLTRCRRTRHFPRRGDGLCAACPYAALCLRTGR